MFICKYLYKVVRKEATFTIEHSSPPTTFSNGDIFYDIINFQR